jgi:hypothetical protein
MLELIIINYNMYGLYVINIYYIMDCQIISVMKWLNSVSDLLYVMKSRRFNVSNTY